MCDTARVIHAAFICGAMRGIYDLRDFGFVLRPVDLHAVAQAFEVEPFSRQPEPLRGFVHAAGPGEGGLDHRVFEVLDGGTKRLIDPDDDLAGPSLGATK